MNSQLTTLQYENCFCNCKLINIKNNDYNFGIYGKNLVCFMIGYLKHELNLCGFIKSDI
jgi:hypothetical protein